MSIKLQSDSEFYRFRQRVLSLMIILAICAVVPVRLAAQRPADLRPPDPEEIIRTIQRTAEGFTDRPPAGVPASAVIAVIAVSRDGQAMNFRYVVHNSPRVSAFTLLESAFPKTPVRSYLSATIGNVPQSAELYRVATRIVYGVLGRER